MWLFLWVVFVLTAAGFFLWSYHATYEQKRTWKSFAQKYNLQFVPGKLMDSPAMTGVIKDREVNFYPQLVDMPTGQKQTQNVVEVYLNKVPDLICVVSSQGLSDFVLNLELPEPFQVDNKYWPRNLLSRTFEDEAPEIWFMQNQKRIEAIQKIAKLPFDFAFFSDAEKPFVAVRTPMPLSNAKQMNMVMGTLFDVVEKLESDVDYVTDAPDSEDEKDVIETEIEISNDEKNDDNNDA